MDVMCHVVRVMTVSVNGHNALWETNMSQGNTTCSDIMSMVLQEKLYILTTNFNP